MDDLFPKRKGAKVQTDSWNEKKEGAVSIALGNRNIVSWTVADTWS